MILTSEHIRGILKQTWPDLNQIWLMDAQYEVIPMEWLEKAMKDCSISGLVFRKDLWDCDNYALQLHAKVQLYQYEMAIEGKLTSDHSWAFGECTGFNRDVFGDGIHGKNLAITDKGIVLVEPQEMTISQPDEFYTPFFVKF